MDCNKISENFSKKLSNHSRTYARYKCHCGNTFEHRIDLPIKHCGCVTKKRVNSTTPEMENKILVLHSQSMTMKEIAYETTCALDTVKSVLTRHNFVILRGELGPRHSTWKGFKDLSMTYWHSILRGAAARDIKVEISIEDAYNQFERQQGKCALTGKELNLGSRKYKLNASLDRINSNKGYTKDNIQWVLKLVNKMKNNLSEYEFIKMCDLISRYKLRLEYV